MESVDKNCVYVSWAFHFVAFSEIEDVTMTIRKYDLIL